MVYNYTQIGVSNFQQNILNEIQTKMNADLGNIVTCISSVVSTTTTGYDVTFTTNVASDITTLITSFNSHYLYTYNYTTSLLPFNTSQLRVSSTTFTRTDVFYLPSNVDGDGGNITSVYLLFNTYGNSVMSYYSFRLYNTSNNTVIIDVTPLTSNTMTLAMSMSLLNEPCIFEVQMKTSNTNYQISLSFLQFIFTNSY
jgi:hypothetical protein